jgi:hypothetical protein
MGRMNFHILDQQNHEWFIARLLPHIRKPLIQQKVSVKLEALEISTKLESSPLGDNGGVEQVYTQLDTLKIKMEEVTKGKEKREKVRCTKCRTQGHHKDEFSAFT